MEKKADFIDELMIKTKAEPNYNNITRVIRLVKQIFLSKEDEKEDAKGKS